MPVLRPYRLAALAVATALAASALAACGSGTPSQVSLGAPGSNDINRQPRDKIVDGGTLRWPEPGIPANYNYNNADGIDAASNDVILGLLQQPFYANAQGVPRVNPNLLTSASVTATSPKQVVTYKINPKAFWYDGTPITEADFAAQWKALNGTDPAFNVASTTGYDHIESVAKGADDREVSVTFAKPFSDWQSLFTPLYPASTNSTADAFNNAWAGKLPTTAGPFKLDSIDRTAKIVTLVRNEKWWGAPAKLDKIIYRAIDLDAQSDSLVNGEVDLQYGIGSHVAYYQKVLGKPGIGVHRAAGPVWANLTLNGASGPLTDPTVRKAVTVGVDRKQIVSAIIGPLGVPPTPLGNHIFFLNQNGYQDNSGDLGGYDPTRAKQLLDQAGWTASADGRTRAKGGQQLNLRMVIANNDTSKQIASLVQNQLAQIGVTVTIQPVPGNDFYSNYVIPGNFDIAPVTLGGNAYPISTATPVFANPKPGANGKLQIQQNYSRIGSDQIDQLMTQALSSLDPAQSIKYANQADAAIWQLDAIIPLYQRPQVVATKSTLANYGAPGVEDTPYENIGFTKS
jgi:peptide/nickel transport system substrate-binding protein